MKVIGLDHLVLNVKDIDKSLEFYGNILGMEVLRLEEFRSGQVGFPSVRFSPQTILDLFSSPDISVDPKARNLNHYCLLVEPTELEQLAKDMEAKGVYVERLSTSRWGAQGNGASLYVQDPDGNTVEIKHY